MPILQIEKTNFTAGEIAPQLLGRTDLRAYDNGAQTLRNVFIHPTGGVTRRSGLRFIDAARGAGRLASFEFNTQQVYLLVFSDRHLDIYRSGVRVADLAAPWTIAQLSRINWTQSADTLLVVHPDVQPVKITRGEDDSWHIAPWSFFNKDGRVYSPCFKFSEEMVALQPSGLSSTVRLTASAPVFLSGHVGVHFRINNKEVQITNVISETQADADVKESLVSTDTTKDWSEQAFSPVRGWPASVCFHQDRLVIGGSRDLPNYLWLSKSADLFNFDTGEGLDDEAIEFPILSDQVNAIQHVFSGRHLQVFTSGAEWMVTGDPLTPTSIQLRRQTRIGSPIDRTIPPRDVDGATLFVPRNGAQLREFLFTDAEQAYQATDLGMLSSHLISKIIDMDFDKSSRLLHVIMSDGSMATLTVYRDEQVSAWTLQQTQGSFLSVAIVDNQTYILVHRDNGFNIELFDNDLHVDAGLIGSAAAPTKTWSGAEHLDGLLVKVVADNVICPDQIVEGGTIELLQAAKMLQIGLGFKHIIEPLPPAAQNFGSIQNKHHRLVAITFRFWETGALRLDVGSGPVDMKLELNSRNLSGSFPTLFCGDRTVRAIGWRRGGVTPLWRIEQDTPSLFTLLSVTTELSINR